MSNTSTTVSAIDTGDTSFMLISTVLVMIMTPGLGFFYGGLVRTKNIVNTMMMSFLTLGVVSIQWVFWGYSLSFAPGNSFYGGGKFLGLRDVGFDPNPDYAGTIPHYIFMLYQMMFAVVTPAIASGAIVERMPFRAYIIFVVIWTTVCYDMIAHWVWSEWTVTNPETGLSENRYGWLRTLGALDFAGGTVVHISSGVSGLVAAIIVGKRRDVKIETLRPANVTYVLLGGALLWFGWFGFNGGSALASSGLAAVAMTNTQVATAAAFTTWMILDALIKKQVTVIGAVSGAVIGLVAITPAAGFVKPLPSIAIGLITTVICYFALILKEKVLPKLFPQVDDSLDVFSCHGIGGIIGALLTGLFATTEINPAGANGAFYGNPILLAYQLAGVLATIVASVIWTIVILVPLKYTIGVRVDSELLDLGLDHHLHGPKSRLQQDDVIVMGGMNPNGSKESTNESKELTDESPEVKKKKGSAEKVAKKKEKEEDDSDNDK